MTGTEVQDCEIAELHIRLTSTVCETDNTGFGIILKVKAPPATGIEVIGLKVRVYFKVKVTVGGAG